MKDWQDQNTEANAAGIFLSTAHPCKFPDVYTENLVNKIELPDQIQELVKKDKHAVSLRKGFEGFKEYLLTNK